MCLDWGDVPTWLTVVVGACGLWFVWRQLGTVASQIKLQTHSEYTKRYAEILGRWPEDINNSDFKLAGRKDHDSIMRAMRSYFDLSFEEWDLNEKKLIDSQFWDVWRGGMKTALSKPAFQQAWVAVKETSDYGGGFESFIDALDIKSTGR